MHWKGHICIEKGQIKQYYFTFLGRGLRGIYNLGIFWKLNSPGFSKISNLSTPQTFRNLLQMFVFVVFSGTILSKLKLQNEKLFCLILMTNLSTCGREFSRLGYWTIQLISKHLNTCILVQKLFFKNLFERFVLLLSCLPSE